LVRRPLLLFGLMLVLRKALNCPFLGFPFVYLMKTIAVNIEVQCFYEGGLRVLLVVRQAMK
jgi:hypothetical protein